MLPLVHHPAYVAPLPEGHRFPMRKYARLMDLLRERGLATGRNSFTPEPAPRSWLELAHTPDYVLAVLEQRLSPEAERRLGLPVSPQVALRSRASCAGTVLAARLALEHGLACSTAGGSHHAFAGFGSGFCVFNDVAVACRVLLEEGLVRRILVVDLDVHQGDGTAAIMEGEPRVTTLSLHCRTNFPARKQQSDLDVALDPGTGDEAYLAVLEAVLPGLLERVRPDLVFYDAGVDPHAEDRLGRLALSDAGLYERDRYAIATCLAMSVPVACVIGGGYTPCLDTLARRHGILFETAAGLM
ncbi:histone deacetylase, partial [Geminicoccaceae bacterium 1502E]|nr:histone deacetylase [Geminicoccaceae bacterium 1502E]